MERLELRSLARTTRGKQVKRLRAGGWIPAVVYGADMPAKSIQVQERSLFTTLKESGSTTLINLFVGDESEPHVVLAREIQRDVITGQLVHVDFYQVRLTETVKTMPRLEFVGESPLVKLGDAVLIHGMTEIEVECLPTDLINSIPVDVSVLERMDDNILVSDLPVPSGVTVLADPGDVVASVVPTRMVIEEEVEVEEAEALELGMEVEAEAEAEAEEEALADA
jgi:large subunit ribosomal protein L25